MMLSLISLISPIMGLLVIICIVIKNWNNTEHKNLKKYVLPLGMLFGVLGYSLVFNHNANDLSRYYDAIISFKNSSLYEIIQIDKEKLYIQDILYYLVSRTGNEHIIAFLTGFIVYSISNYVMFDTIERSKRKFKTSEIVMLSIISVGIVSPYLILCNVRCIMAYSIVCFAIYRDLVQEKKNLITLLLYIIPIGLHSSAIIIIFIRIISGIFKSINTLALLISIFLPTIINFAHSSFQNIGFGAIGKLIKNVINKAYYYLYWTEGGWASKVGQFFSNKFNRITGCIFLVIIIFILLVHNKRRIKNKPLDNKMIRFLYFSAIFALGCLSIKTGAFWRFESIPVLFCPIILVNLIENKESEKRILILIFIFSALVFMANLISMFRNIYFYKTIFNLATTSGLKILFEIIKGIINIV